MFTVCALAGVLGVAFIGCGDDGSSSPSAKGLPAEVADMEELETYGCGMDVIGEKVYVTELEENYECDGEKWFKSYDQTKQDRRLQRLQDFREGRFFGQRQGRGEIKQFRKVQQFAADRNP